MLDSAAHTLTRRGPIADALIGVWTLRKYSEVTEGLPPQYPFGHDPEGLLIYTPDGFVSALLMARGRPNLSGSGFAEGTPEEYTSAGKRFIGYSGGYEVDEVRSIVTHRPTVAFAPNMIGSFQHRLVDLAGDVLILTAEHVQPTGLKATKSRLEWTRVKASQPEEER